MVERREVDVEHPVAALEQVGDHVAAALPEPPVKKTRFGWVIVASRDAGSERARRRPQAGFGRDFFLLAGTFCRYTCG
jgi:hypothetical protein